MGRNWIEKVVYVNIAIGLTGLTACQKPAEKASSTPLIYSDRAQYKVRYAIVQLKEPALLKSAHKQGGQLVIDPASKGRLLAEQDIAIQDLKRLSPEIKINHIYRLVYNGLAIAFPEQLSSQISGLVSISRFENSNSFARPAPVSKSQVDSSIPIPSLNQANASELVGAAEAQRLGYDGRGITVAVLDTGIDYTHAMFGGPGTKEAFENNKHDVVEEGTFPTAKVIGGIDLVGVDYDSASPDITKHQPKPDNDPIDDDSHGTHVSGTIAGLGDGKTTYTGIAPEAKLLAVKVFGKGSTSDSVVVAGLEYAADPNGDFNLDDKADVVNMSLGSAYGTNLEFYSDAVDTLADSGTFMSISAGNNGDEPYIVGAPGISKKAISVAASIDDAAHNWNFDQSQFVLATGEPITVLSFTATFGRTLEASKGVQGTLVPVGLGNDEYPQELADQVRGNVALVDRGVAPFFKKFENALKAGAIGVVVANNVEGEPINMGGDGSIDLPGIMITKDIGDKIKSEIASGRAVTVRFLIPEKAQRPERIDTIAPFSSRGPRSDDGLIKPEITAPGADIISAGVGTGAGAARMSGTSMAAPQIAGAAAILRQRYPNLSAASLKALMMQTAKQLRDADGKDYSVSRQGAGRIQLLPALNAPFVVKTPALSLGIVSPNESQKLKKDLIVRALPGEGSQRLALSFESKNGLSLASQPEAFEVSEGKDTKIPLEFIMKIADQGFDAEYDGFISLRDTDGHIRATVPVLGIYRPKSKLNVDIQPGSGQGQQTIRVANKSDYKGLALPFISLGTDDKSAGDPIQVGSCDLAKVGYRVIRKTIKSEPGEPMEADFLQIGVSLYRRLTHWRGCDVSVLIDANVDGVAEQELFGFNRGEFPMSVVVDAAAVRKLRHDWEGGLLDPAQTGAFEEVMLGTEGLVQAASTYTLFPNSRVAVVEAPLASLKTTSLGKIRLKIGVTNEQNGAIDADFLGQNDGKWITLDPTKIPVNNLPAAVEIGAKAQTEFSIENPGAAPIVVFSPLD